MLLLKILTILSAGFKQEKKVSIEFVQESNEEAVVLNKINYATKKNFFLTHQEVSLEDIKIENDEVNISTVGDCDSVYVNGQNKYGLFVGQNCFEEKKIYHLLLKFEKNDEFYYDVFELFCESVEENGGKMVATLKANYLGKR